MWKRGKKLFLSVAKNWNGNEQSECFWAYVSNFSGDTLPFLMPWSQRAPNCLVMSTNIIAEGSSVYVCVWGGVLKIPSPINKTTKKKLRVRQKSNSPGFLLFTLTKHMLNWLALFISYRTSLFSKVMLKILSFICSRSYAQDPEFHNWIQTLDGLWQTWNWLILGLGMLKFQEVLHLFTVHYNIPIWWTDWRLNMWICLLLCQTPDPSRSIVCTPNGRRFPRSQAEFFHITYYLILLFGNAEEWTWNLMLAN